MKKFKILEKSRFLNNQDMDQLQGGDMSCSQGQPYAMCDGAGTYIMCRARSLNGFSSGSCNGVANGYLVCGSDMYYASQSCGLPSTNTSNTCPTPQTGYSFSPII